MRYLQLLIVIVLLFSLSPSSQTIPVSADNADSSFLSYGAFIGGTDIEIVSDIGLDMNSNFYLTGSTESSDFPVYNAFQESYQGSIDAFIYGSDLDGKIIWSTYLGGSELDFGDGIEFDTDNNLYIAGTTVSKDFPVKNAFQYNNSGHISGFVSSFDPSGNLRWSTYLGGSDSDFMADIGIDSNNNIYLIGRTSSDDFPTLNAHQSQFGGDTDIFVTSFSSNGTILWSTYLGSNGEDEGWKIALDSEDNVYIVGTTDNTGYPTLNAYQNNHNGGTDVAITSFNSSGKIRWSTYFGASKYDSGHSIAIDGQDNVYICGMTVSKTFPILNAYQSLPNDGFIASFSSDGALRWSTFFGGSNSDNLADLSADLDNKNLTGTTLSNDFPLLNSYIDELNPYYYEKSFVSSFSSSGSIRWSTYLGGSSSDVGWAITVDDEQKTYVSGDTCSTDFPTRNINSSKYQGYQDGFISVLHNPLTDTDEDGMLFYYEVKNGLDPNRDDASEDLDNDGLTNLEEYNIGTRADNEDTDGDGDLDGYEVANGFDPLDPDDHSTEELSIYSGFILAPIILIAVVNHKRIKMTTL